MFVHGLNGHPERTWKNATTGFFWPPEVARKIPEARVLLFGYDTDISTAVGSNHTRIKSIALSLLNRLRNERQEDDVSIASLVFKH